MRTSSTAMKTTLTALKQDGVDTGPPTPVSLFAEGEAGVELAPSQSGRRHTAGTSPAAGRAGVCYVGAALNRRRTSGREF